MALKDEIGHMNQTSAAGRSDPRSSRECFRLVEAF